MAVARVFQHKAEERHWHRLYSSINLLELNRRLKDDTEIREGEESLDFLIGCFENLLNHIEPTSGERIERAFKRKESKIPLREADIWSKIYDCVLPECREYLSSDREYANKLSMNLISNLLRYLKRLRTGEPIFLLPKKDIELGTSFIDTLRYPNFDYFEISRISDVDDD